MKQRKNKQDYSSFRDPAGYIYYENGKVYRRINKCYIKTFEHLIESGLYDELLNEGLIIKHKEVEREKDYIILEVEKVPFISYPYEWCFDQLRDAALLTLKINLIALKYGMILKDASVYNVQFINSKAVFIDTLSFDMYEEGSPWGAYGQFTRHFIAPLLLMNYVDDRMNSLLKNYIDGVPLDICEAILKKRGGFFAKQHIVWQNKAVKKHNDDGKTNKNIKINISKQSLININMMMQNQISSLKRKVTYTEWDNYYENTNYTEEADKLKQKIVLDFVSKIKFKDDLVLDVGANDGKYSRLVSEYFKNVISIDIDNNAVNRNYLISRDKNENILPLVFDFNNPTPAIGFACRERDNFTDRCNIKVVMALALIHHIAISNNVPLIKIAEWFSEMGEYLVIEFVPKKDSQVELLLKTRTDIFDNYNEKYFEECFSEYFKILEKKKVTGSERTMYLMVRK